MDIFLGYKLLVFCITSRCICCVLAFNFRKKLHKLSASFSAYSSILTLKLSGTENKSSVLCKKTLNLDLLTALGSNMERLIEFIL
tara:strand:- start:166 stop:420 length:255 start_codon:yes stop_codon:yes gene_type:complete